MDLAYLNKADGEGHKNIFYDVFAKSTNEPVKVTSNILNFKLYTSNSYFFNCGY